MSACVPFRGTRGPVGSTPSTGKSQMKTTDLWTLFNPKFYVAWPWGESNLPFYLGARRDARTKVKVGRYREKVSSLCAHTKAQSCYMPCTSDSYMRPPRCAPRPLLYISLAHASPFSSVCPFSDLSLRARSFCSILRSASHTTHRVSPYISRYKRCKRIIGALTPRCVWPADALRSP